MSVLIKKLKRLIFTGVIIYLFAVLSLIIDALRDTGECAEYAVILGNKVELTGEPSPRLRARLNAGAELFQAGRVEKIIVSGGFGKEGFDEATVMAHYLITYGIPKDCILLDQNGINSHATSVNATKLIGTESSIIAVTQLYHLSRTKLSLRNVGYNTVSGHYPHYFEPRDIYGITREIPAWIKYKLKHL